jgi:hypothetical protein
VRKWERQGHRTKLPQPRVEDAGDAAVGCGVASGPALYVQSANSVAFRLQVTVVLPAVRVIWSSAMVSDPLPQNLGCYDWLCTAASSRAPEPHPRRRPHTPAAAPSACAARPGWAGSTPSQAPWLVRAQNLSQAAPYSLKMSRYDR